jgi:hypothetical protein
VTPGEKLLVGAAALTVVGGVVIVGVLEHNAHAAPPSPAPSPAPTGQHLTPGHRYSLALSCPLTLPLPPPLSPGEVSSDPTALAAAANLLGIPNVSVVSIRVDPLGTGFTATFDYTGSAALPLPAIQAGGATACTTTLTDMGPTPASQ